MLFAGLGSPRESLIVVGRTIRSCLCLNDPTKHLSSFGYASLAQDGLRGAIIRFLVRIGRYGQPALTVGLFPSVRDTLNRIHVWKMGMKFVAILPDAAGASACLNAAAAAARDQSGASIEVLHVMADPTTVFASEMMDTEYLRGCDEAAVLERANLTHDALEAWLVAHPDAPVVPRWKQVTGSEVKVIRDAARYADLLVIPRGVWADQGEAMIAVF